MSKKETRRAARQAFPGGAPQVRRRDNIRGTKPQAVSKKSSSKSRGGTRQTLRPPSLKRAVIQGVILAVLYFVLIRFIWKDPGATTATYVIVPLVGFFMFTGVAYAVDRFTYQRRLRKLKGSSK
jgi:VIT1/CCC1 family predicted Fe2+/Mn2+ transporter